MANEKFYAKKYTTRLLKAIYLNVDDQSSDNKSSTSIRDFINVVSIDFEKLVIDVERKAQLVPSGLFEISVAFRLSIEVDKKTETLLANLESLKKYVEDHLANIVEKTSTLEKCSLLISQLTATDFAPLITPPSVLVDEK